ncbi:MAG: LysR family transcriptional regulator [Sandarakinorhabdus sp.]
MRELDVVLEISETGSLRKAATRLNITPSALTRQVQELEAEFGAPLFERTSQGMRPTAAGHALLRYARTQKSAFQTLREDLSEIAGGRTGHVAIACSQAIAQGILPAEVAAFRIANPRVTFDVSAAGHGTALRALAAYEIHLALVLQPPPASGVTMLFQDEAPVCAVLKRDHPLAGAGPVRLADCLRFPLAMPGRAFAIRPLLDAAILRTRLAPWVVLESGVAGLLCNYALHEPQAVAFQVACGVDADAGLCLRPIDRRDMLPPELLLLRMTDRALSPAAAQFAQHLAARLPRQRPSAESPPALNLVLQ